MARPLFVALLALSFSLVPFNSAAASQHATLATPESRFPCFYDALLAPIARWLELQAQTMQSQASRPAPRPSRFRSYRVDLPALTAQLEQAPAGVEITLPLPDGGIEGLRLVEKAILSAQ